MSRARIAPSGKVVLITGAGQGIGAAVARRLVGQGAAVALVDVNADALESTASALASERVLTVQADVRQLDSMVAAVRKVNERFGPIDIVVANAGITPPPATLRTVDPDDFGRVIDVNLLGVFNTARACVEDVIATRGHIQVIGSCAAFAPGMGGSAYMISKAGVEQLGRALDIELSAHQASAGISYFGIVETSLARATLDDDELGKEIGAQLPWPLNRRISADDAAEVIVDAVVTRRARTIAPRSWNLYAALRGVINPVLDNRLHKDRKVRDIILRLEGRAREKVES